ncbi:MAG: MGH1-like glycoside hydrolase domain-containing protein [Terrimicrobiaceae bacterium]
MNHQENASEPNREVVGRHIRSILPKLVHPPKGKLPYPALGVGYGQHYAGYIYCWDNHHMSLRFAAEGQSEQMKYFLGNMLACQTPSGFIPSIINIASGGIGAAGPFHAQPWLAQNAAIDLDLTGNKDWAAEVFPKLELYLEHWTARHAAPYGLFRWREAHHPFDNEIVLSTCHDPDCILPPDLNSLLFLELRSIGFLAGAIGEPDKQRVYLERADALKDAINHWLWDETIGSYGAHNLLTGRCQISYSSTLDGDAGSLSSDVGRFAYLSSPAFMPLYAGIAPSDRAERMIQNYVLSPEHFRSPFGIRSLSKASEFYNQARWGNPGRSGDRRRLTNSSCQGPVWIPLSWFVFHALLHYGFTSEAESLADDTQKVLAGCIGQFGYMRENFHAETGEGLYADHFASWNILADIMHDFLPGRKAPFRLIF